MKRRRTKIKLCSEMGDSFLLWIQPCLLMMLKQPITMMTEKSFNRSRLRRRSKNRVKKLVKMRESRKKEWRKLKKIRLIDNLSCIED